MILMIKMVNNLNLIDLNVKNANYQVISLIQMVDNLNLIDLNVEIMTIK